MAYHYQNILLGAVNYLFFLTSMMIFLTAENTAAHEAHVLNSDTLITCISRQLYLGDTHIFPYPTIANFPLYQ